MWNIGLSPWEDVSSTFITWYDIDLWPQGQIYRVWHGFVFRPQLFLSFDVVILCLARECITMVGCVVYIHELYMTLTFDLNIKITFSRWIWQDVFALWHKHTKFWHMGVSPRDNMLCTFLTLVWLWPLTYMWVAGVSLVSFFLTVFILLIFIYDS